jgi:hypothetical protein
MHLTYFATETNVFAPYELSHEALDHFVRQPVEPVDDQLPRNRLHRCASLSPLNGRTAGSTASWTLYHLSKVSTQPFSLMSRSDACPTYQQEPDPKEVNVKSEPFLEDNIITVAYLVSKGEEGTKVTPIMAVTKGVTPGSGPA